MRAIHIALQTVLLSAFYNVLVWCEEPHLRIIPEVSKVRAPTGSPYSIRCFMAYGRTEKFSNMTWTDPKGRALPEGLHFSLGIDVRRSSSTLKLMFLIPVVRHNGEYVCSALYMATNETDNTTTSVNPKIIKASISVEFYVRPKVTKFQNLTAAEGQQAVLECTAKGDPTPNVTIRKDNGHVFRENGDNRTRVEHKNFFSDTTTTLTFSQVERTDDGLYYCSAESNGMNVTEAAYLDVQYAPRMNVTLVRKVIAWSENSTNLTCTADANPNAVVRWKFQNGDIDPEDQHYEEYSFHRGNRIISNLVVRRNVVNDSNHDILGNYTCIAKNPLGQNSIDIILEEANVPGKISQVIIDTATPTSITFQIFGPVYDGGMPVTAFVVNYASREGHNITTFWPKGFDYIVRRLTPGAFYTFELAAKNAVGVGAWTRMDYVMPKGNDSENRTLVTKDVNIVDYPDRFEIIWKVHDHNGQTKRAFVVTYFDDGRVMVQHSKGDNSSSLFTRSIRHVKHADMIRLHDDSTDDDAGSFANN